MAGSDRILQGSALWEGAALPEEGEYLLDGEVFGEDGLVLLEQVLDPLLGEEREGVLLASSHVPVVVEHSQFFPGRPLSVLQQELLEQLATFEEVLLSQPKGGQCALPPGLSVNLAGRPQGLRVNLHRVAELIQTVFPVDFSLGSGW